MGFMIGLTVIAAMCFAWYVFSEGRSLRREHVFGRLATALGFHRVPHELDTDADTDEHMVRMGLDTGLVYEQHIRGEKGGLRVDIFDQIQSQIVCSASIESHTVIEITPASGKTLEFILQPECRLTRFVHKVDGKWGLKYGDDLEFSRRNFLRADDEPAVRALFNADVRALLCDNKALWIQGTGSAYRFYLQSNRLSVKRAVQLLDRVLPIAEALG